MTCLNTLNSTNGTAISGLKRCLWALIALFIIPITGISVDIYTPSLPAISHYFHVDKALVQYTITVYMLGLGIMQLFAGGISDSFGRKKPFLISMVIFMVATLAITFVSDIYQLLFLRLIQGIAVGTIIVSMRAVIPDLFEGKELYKMTSYMTVAWSIGPIIAPAIGGYLQQHIGWQANFYFLFFYSLSGFALVLLFLPETSYYRHPFGFKLILQRYHDILFNREFLRDLLTNGLLYSIMLLFAVVGAFLIQNVLQYSAAQFGRFALLLGLAWFLGSMSTRFMLNIPFKIKARLGLWSMFAIALTMVILNAIFPMNIYCIIAPMFCMFWLGGMVFPNYFAHALSLYPKTSGSANALFGAAVFLIAGSISGLGSLLKSTSPLPLATAYLVLVMICLGIFYYKASSQAASKN